jgi:hypothetical protein
VGLGLVWRHVYEGPDCCWPILTPTLTCFMATWAHQYCPLLRARRFIHSFVILSTPKEAYIIRQNTESRIRVKDATRASIALNGGASVACFPGTAAPCLACMQRRGKTRTTALDPLSDARSSIR